MIFRRIRYRTSKVCETSSIGHVTSLWPQHCRDHQYKAADLKQFRPLLSGTIEKRNTYLSAMKSMKMGSFQL